MIFWLIFVLKMIFKFVFINLLCALFTAFYFLVIYFLLLCINIPSKLKIWKRRTFWISVSFFLFDHFLGILALKVCSVLYFVHFQVGIVFIFLFLSQLDKFQFKKDSFFESFGPKLLYCVLFIIFASVILQDTCNNNNQIFLKYNDKYKHIIILFIMIPLGHVISYLFKSNQNSVLSHAYCLSFVSSNIISVLTLNGDFSHFHDFLIFTFSFSFQTYELYFLLTHSHRRNTSIIAYIFVLFYFTFFYTRIFFQTGFVFKILYITRLIAYFFEIICILVILYHFNKHGIIHPIDINELINEGFQDD